MNWWFALVVLYARKPNTGREGVIEQFMASQMESIEPRNRCTLFLGQRGMGKTALQLELSERVQAALRC